VDLDLDLDLRAPPKRRSRRTRPAGRRTWMRGVFRAGRMPPRKIPPAPRTRCAASGAQAGCAFFAPGFFAQAKKGGSRRHGAKALELAVAVAIAKLKKDQGQLAALAPHPPSGHLLPQAGEGLKLYRTRRRGALSLRQVSLHKQRKVARAVTARKLLTLPWLLPLPSKEGSRTARCARPSSALRAPSPASGRRVEAVPGA